MTDVSCSRLDLENLKSIVRYCEDIDYLIKLHGSDESDFQDISLQYSCVFSLIQIGEHVKRLSSEFKEEHPDIDWRGIAGLRDLITHQYDEINISRVRSTVLNRIPTLENECRSIINESLIE